MTEIVLVKRGLRLTDAERQLLNRTLFGVVDGLADEDKRGWRKFWNGVAKMEEGELFTIATKFPRNSKLHRKFFALLKVGFDAWEPPRKMKSYRRVPISKNFEQFRSEVTILAGFYEQTFDLKGRMVLRAKSISFGSMDEAEFEKVYEGVATVLLEKVLRNYKDREDLNRVVDQIVEFL